MRTSSESLLFVLFLVLAGVFIMRLVEARLSLRSLTEPGFTLALSLFIPCALIGLIRMRQVDLWTSSGVVDYENLVQQIHSSLPPFYFGIGASITALLIHSLLYLFSRSRQPSNIAL